MKAAIVVLLCLAGCSGNDGPTAQPNFFKIDSGEGVSTAEGRVILSSWHAGSRRSSQGVCVEPPAALGPEAWARFEACLHYLNGLIDEKTYRKRVMPAPEE